MELAVLQRGVWGLVCLGFAVAQSRSATGVWDSLFASFLFSLGGTGIWAAYHCAPSAAPSAAPVAADPKLYAIITNHRISSSTRSPFVEYKIDVECWGEKWSVWRRYSDFAKIPSSRPLPPVPGSRWWWSRVDLDFIAKRTLVLNEYLASTCEQDVLREFLKA